MRPGAVRFPLGTTRYAARAGAGRRATRPIRAGEPQGLLATKNGVVALLACVPAIYMCFFSAARDIATLGLAVAVSFAVAAHLVARRLFIGPFVPMIVISVIYLYLSFNHSLPTAWTRYYRPDFIIRQWMWVPLLALFSSSFAIFFLTSRQFIQKNVFLFCILTVIAGRVSLFLSPLSLSFSVRATIYTLTPENATFFIAFFMWLFSMRRMTFEANLITLAVIAICTSTQSLLLALTALGVRHFGFGRTAVVGLILIIVVAMLIAPNYPTELYRLDTSSGFRAVLWRDATDAFTQSKGLGVGFGTESFRNLFDFEGIPDWQAAAEDTDNRLLIGTHNSAFDIALRMGVPGLLALCYFAWSIGAQTLRGHNSDRDINTAVLFMLVLNNGLNMGVASINFMMTTALGAGWLLASNARNSYPIMQKNGQASLTKGMPQRSSGLRRLPQ